MAEAPESEPVPSSSESTVVTAINDDEGPSSPKKRKIDEKELEKLELRLGGILCCAVCLDLPQAAVYQCSNGHLMCAPCFTHLLADARLRDEAATCPNCRVEISKTTASRNLAVEKTVSELPSECRYCTRVFPRHSLQHHEDKLCEDRRYKFAQIVVDTAPKRRYLDSLVRIVSSVYALLLASFRRSYLFSEPSDATAKRRRYRRAIGCKYSCIGCRWAGPAHEARAHEAACALPARCAADLVPALAERERRARDDYLVYSHVLDLLSYEKITFTDLQLKPYRTEEFVHKLYYESSRFVAFDHQWVVKAFVNKNQRDPTQTNDREISYQLILKSKAASALGLQWVVVRGPHGEARVRACVCAHAFAGPEGAGAGAGAEGAGTGGADAPPRPLPLADPADTNRLLSNKAIHFRLIMFLSCK